MCCLAKRGKGTIKSGTYKRFPDLFSDPSNRHAACLCCALSLFNYLRSLLNCCISSTMSFISLFSSLE